MIRDKKLLSLEQSSQTTMNAFEKRLSKSALLSLLVQFIAAKIQSHTKDVDFLETGGAGGKQPGGSDVPHGWFKAN